MVGTQRRFVVSWFTFAWENLLEDIIWIAVTIAFFALSIGYVRFCERMKQGEKQ